MIFRRNLIIAIILAASPSIFPIPAFAQQFEGPYITVGGGMTFLRSESTSSVTLPGQTVAAIGTRAANINSGFSGEASAGYSFGGGLRSEIEGDFLHDRVRGLQGLPAGSAVYGSEKQYGAFLNAFYDFNFPQSPIAPYLGAGAGYQEQAWSGISAKAATAYATSSDGSGGRFAYQLIAGAAFPIKPIPGLAVTAEYRFIDRTGSVPAAPALGLNTGNATDNTVMLGLRYAFNAVGNPDVEPGVALPVAAAPPESIAPPAPAGNRMYIVYFAWDRSYLTDQAKQIISEAATAAATGTTQVAVTGHTDSSGNTPYNQALSLRRAHVVAGELIRLGVPAEEISIEADADSNQAVQTAPGERNAQNRRVEILLN